MRKFTLLFSFLVFLLIFCGNTSCKTKEGCGLEEKYGAKIGEDGNISSKRGKSNLFSKKQRKRMGRG
jgi:hypothetical protein